MWRQIKILTAVVLCNTWGANEVRYSKDRNKRRRFLLMETVFVMLIIMFAFYVTTIAYFYAKLGAAQIIPSYMLAMTSVLILFFSIYKAGSIIFQVKTYENLITLPISPAAIVISRFLTMYMNDLALSLIIMLPSIGVYIFFARPHLYFYFMIPIGILLLPLIPMTIATAAGALIIGISSRMKHKNLVTIVLSMLLTVGFIGISASGSFTQGQFTEEKMVNLSAILSEKMNALYPPVKLFTEGIIKGDLVAFGGFSILSIGLFALFVLFTQWKFVEICSALRTENHAKPYVMTELKQHSQLQSLYGKELRRYFSSPLYVMNTLIGFVMMAAAAIALFCIGTQKVESMMQMPGMLDRIAPIAFAMMGIISSTTLSAISLEGKQWWIIKTMPVSTRTVFDSKILVNLTVAFPCYIIAELFLCMAIKTDLPGYLWLIVVPGVYLIFSSILGISVNAKFPNFEWESEAVAVKQSVAVLLGMCISLLATGIPIALQLLAGEKYDNLIMAASVLLLASITGVLYLRNNQIDLKKLG